MTGPGDAIPAPVRDRADRLLAYEIFKLDQADIRVSDAAGRDIHISPHDVFRRSGDPHHVDTAEADVHADAVILHGTIAVVMWHAGQVLGAVVYDRDARVRRVA